MENTQQLDQQALQNLLGGTSGDVGLVPEGLMDMLVTGLIIMAAFMLVFVILFIINFVHKWKVQSAIITMQKDVADMKGALERFTAPQPRSSDNSQPRKVEVTTNN